MKSVQSHHRRRARLCGLQLVSLLLGVSTALGSIASSAQGNLILAPADAAARSVLADHRVRWAKPDADVGAVPESLELAQMSIVLKRSPERQQAFDQYLSAQKDPTSPDYQHWLSPSEIGARFGSSQNDIDAISDWLHAQGLHVDSVSNNRMRISFSGSAAKVSAAFSTPLHYFQAGSEKRMSTLGDPQIPAAFAGAIDAVSGLNSRHFVPQHRVAAVRTSSLAKAAAQPALTDCQSSPCSNIVFPSDFSYIYNLSPVAAQGIDGSGQTIAVVGRSRVNPPDVANFQSLAGLPAKAVTVVIPPNGIDPGAPATTCVDSDTATPSCSKPTDAVKDQSEATLDVTRAGSVAPGASILLIASGNVGNSDGVGIAIDYAIDHEPVPAKIIDISFGSCEADNSRADANSLDQFFSQAEMEGISVFVSSGDGGVAGCADLDSAPTANERVSTNIFCSSGHVTCVGGTSFADTENPRLYWNEENGTNFGSARGYIPEGAWNEPLNSDTNAPQVAATGGGVSAYLPKPSWQVGTGVPGNQGRYVPDVSFGASIRDGYFSCLAAQNGSCAVVGNQFRLIVVGGTSASAPSMAGIAALLNQKMGSAQANLNPKLYSLAANPANAVFHDVTIASSGVANCVAATPSMCNNSSAGPSGLSGGLPGFLVGSGYDLATGLGSIDVANLLAHWNDATTIPVNLDQRGLTGTWYNTATSGQGIVMEVTPDDIGAGRGSLFGGWFTFDTTAAGGERWYTLQGEVDNTSPYATLPIYASTGGRFDSPASVQTVAVGQATLQLSDCGHATLSYAFDGDDTRSGSFPLFRLTPNVNCTAAGGGGNTGYPFAGTWYDPANSGQGLVLDLNPTASVLFGAWYTFSDTATPASGAAGQRWYTLQASYSPGAGTVSDIGIFQTASGVFDNPAAVSTTLVGSAQLVFHSCAAATLSYHFNASVNGGSSGSIDIARLTPAPTDCHL
jgi:hypothetical protein